jgi:hypothetical protein
MVEKLKELPCFQKTGRDEELGDPLQWDQLLYECISNHTANGLQVLPSFYNPRNEELYGLRDFSAGGYGGGTQPLTLHHYKNWHRFEAGKAHVVTSACGEDCFLQRFRFMDNWVLVNGYTITHYPDGVDVLPIKKPSRLAIEESRQAGKMTVVSKKMVLEKPGPLSNVRVIAWTGEKRTWRLLDSEIRENGEVWQAYVKRKGPNNSLGDVDDRLPADIANSSDETSDVDSVIVLIWEP